MGSDAPAHVQGPPAERGFPCTLCIASNILSCLEVQATTYRAENSAIMNKISIYHCFTGLILAVLSTYSVGQSIVSSTLLEERIACPGSIVEFTCVTTGSTGLIWRSNDFIGAGSTTQLAFSDGDSEGVTRNLLNSVATLTRNEEVNGERVLESTLRITVSSSTPSTSVTCVRFDGNTAVTKYFTVLTIPTMPQNMVSDQRMDSEGRCIVHLSWNVPDNTAATDIFNYMIHINGINKFNETSNGVIQNLTMTTYAQCDCSPHTVSISAVNHCGQVGENTSTTVINQGQRLPSSTCSTTTEAAPTTVIYTTFDPNTVSCMSNSTSIGNDDQTAIIVLSILVPILAVATVILTIMLLWKYFDKKKSNCSCKKETNIELSKSPSSLDNKESASPEY